MLVDEEKKKVCGLKCRIFLPLFFLIIFLASLIISFIVFLLPAPDGFQTGEVFDIPSGTNISEIANILEENNYISSTESFIILDRVLHLLGKEESLKAGKYIFKQPSDLLEVYRRIAKGESGIDMVEIRTIEGEPNVLVAKIFADSEKMENFSEERFLELAEKEEGFLYPDTYSFSPFADETVVIQSMKDNFDEKTAGLFDGLSESQIREKIIIASLIENEAGSANQTDKRHVSGVIHHRLEIDMRLQLDAVAIYIAGEHVSSSKEIREILDTSTSPYNTYKYKGLPPGPIGNPTVDSIKAALNPMETRDLYYITGKDGIFYYAQTLEGHNANIRNYR